MKIELLDDDDAQSEETGYWFTIMDVVKLIREHGYNTVLEDINDVLREKGN